MQYQSPLKLLNDCTKSEAYFHATGWQGRRRCPKCSFARRIYRLSNNKFKRGICNFRFNYFTYTYIERLQIPFDKPSHLLYLFVLVVLFYRARRYREVSLKTTQKIYTIFRQAIYDVELGGCRLAGR